MAARWRSRADLIGEGGILYQLTAMEYSYGDMTGALFTLQSIQALRDCLTGEEVAGRTFEPAPRPAAPALARRGDRRCFRRSRPP